MDRTIRRYFFYQFFFSLLFWVPIFVEFQKYIGLSDSTIFNIQSIYYVVFAFLEIPTGFIADRLGRRLSLQGSAVVLLIAQLFPIFMQTEVGMLTHFIFIALARSLNSGASSAYLYEYLRVKSASADYKQWEGKARTFSLVGKIVCWGVVGFLMTWHLTLPYWLTAVSAACALVYTWLLPADVVKKTKEPLLFGSSLWRTLRGSHSLVLIMLQGTALFVLVRILQVNLFQPILKSKNFSLESFGAVMAVMTVFEAIGSFKPQLMQRWTKDVGAVSVLSGLMALSIAAIPFAREIGTILSLCVFSFVTGLAFPIQRQLINDAIGESPFRATLISIESILDRSICALIALSIGAYLERGALNQFLWQAAAGTIVVMLGCHLLLRRALRPSVAPTVQ